jgi:hypothetical protein
LKLFCNKFNKKRGKGTNDLNSAHFILILFLDIPTVHRTDELYTVVLGNNITMNCNYSSDPPVTHVQWKYNNSDSLLNIPIGYIGTFQNPGK